MDIEELKSNWDKMHEYGLKPHNDEDVKNIIERGTTLVVETLNKKLFKNVFVLTAAIIISALSIIFFYYNYDNLKHPWINIKLLFSIQLSAFAVFLALFLYSFFFYKLVNRSFTADTVKDFIEITLLKMKKYNLIFNAVISFFLFTSYCSLLNYFIKPDNAMTYIIVITAGIIITIVSYFISICYWKHSMSNYIDNLRSYLVELKS